MMKHRRMAREMALQSLYAEGITGDPVEQIISDVLIMNEQPELDETFMRALIVKAINNRESIDERIRLRSKNWDFNRIALIDKIILRQSIAELLFFEDIPPRVTISEAIELAKEYSTRDSHVFINGILDRIYHDLMEEGRIMPEFTDNQENV